MRLVFPGGESKDIPLHPGTLTLGTSPECDVCLPARGWLAHQATLSSDPQRGVWLDIEPGTVMAHVNARPVRERAMLRPGDLVALGDVRFCLRLQDDAAIESDVPAPVNRSAPDASERAAASRAVLRGVAGPFHGRTFPLAGDILIGRDAQAAIVVEGEGVSSRHAMVELHRDRIVLRAMDQQARVRVNGVDVANAVLHPGDQVALAGHRFVVEAPGLPARGGLEPVSRQRPITQSMPVVDAPMAGEGKADADEGQRFGAWWLLVAAAAIAVLFTVILVYAPR